MNDRNAALAQVYVLARLRAVTGEHASLKERLDSQEELQIIIAGEYALLAKEVGQFKAMRQRRQVSHARVALQTLDPFANSTLHEEPELWQS